MNFEVIKSKLEELQKDPKAAELMEAYDKTDRIEAVSEVAKKLGIDLNAEDLKEYIDKTEAEIKAKTGAVEDELTKINDDELSEVAGGGYGNDVKHGNCKDTFLNLENCWWNDGCDAINSKYWNYIPASCGGLHISDDPDPNRQG